MEIEVVEFYKKEKKSKNDLEGTLHVYVYENDMHFDIRGINVFKKNKFWLFKMPFAKAVENGKIVRFPIFSLTDSEKSKKLINLIREEGIRYIEGKYKPKLKKSA